MTLIIPLNEVKVEGFDEFCNIFDIENVKKAGVDGSDQELIEDELHKLKKENWIVNFIENRRDGFFHLIQIN